MVGQLMLSTRDAEMYAWGHMQGTVDTVIKRQFTLGASIAEIADDFGAPVSYVEERLRMTWAREAATRERAPSQ